MSVEQRQPPTSRKEPAVLASDVDRDAVLVRLHTAYAEGRLNEPELDERIDLVLAARTLADLDQLAADLPSARTAADAGPVEGEKPSGRFHLAYKCRLKRAGSWRPPERYTVVVYKGGGLIDLTEAEFSALVTTIRVVAYKSDVRINVPSGVRVEIGGLGASTEIHGPASPGAPVVRVQAFAYKGTIEARDHLPPR